jgi:hypothetical protein
MSELDESMSAKDMRDLLLQRMDAIQEHRALLLARLDTISAEFAAFTKMAEVDKIEYAKRATRFKLALVGVGLVLLALVGVAWGNHQTATRLENFVTCQTQFNDTVNRATSIRSEASRNWTTATLGYGAVRNDPKSSPEQIADARSHYYDTLRSLAEAQQNNPVPLASNCRLGASSDT